MEIEQREVADYLASVPPLDGLPAEAVERLARAVRITYVRKGKTIIQAGQASERLFLIRSGAVDILFQASEFRGSLGEGEFFAYPALLRDGIARNSIVAVEDCLLYWVSGDIFRELVADFRGVERFFALAESDRLRAAFRQRHEASADNALFRRPVASLLRRTEAITAPETTTIQDAARLMSAHDVSALMITDGDDGPLTGIITDRDMRRRVVGEGTDTGQPVSAVMTPAPRVMDATASGFDAYLQMLEGRLRHLPVVEDGRLIGLISASDLMAQFGQSALYLRRTAQDAPDTTTLRDTVDSLGASLVALVDSGATPQQIGALVSGVGEAVHQRAYALAAEEQGLDDSSLPGFLVFGSLARKDQTLKSDQDNGFLLPDDGSAASDSDETIQRFAQRITDIINAAGYPYCKGDIMATTPAWRQSGKGWFETFRQWIDVPEEKAVMNTTIFFDMRMIIGYQEAFARLQRAVVELASNSRLFLGVLAQNCVRDPVPLGFFRQFVLSSSKGRENTFDLKKQGTAPIVDIARLYALAAGSSAIDTIDRLEAAVAARLMARVDADDLQAAWRFISHIRLVHQANLLREGKAANNNVSPDELSRFDRHHLKDAFDIVRTAQKAVLNRFAGGRAF